MDTKSWPIDVPGGDDIIGKEKATISLEITFQIKAILGTKRQRKEKRMKRPCVSDEVTF